MAEGVNGLPLFKTAILTPGMEQTASCHNWGRPRGVQASPDEPERTAFSLLIRADSVMLAASQRRAPERLASAGQIWRTRAQHQVR
jgi:hypothetical protein